MVNIFLTGKDVRVYHLLTGPHCTKDIQKKHLCIHVFRLRLQALICCTQIKHDTSQRGFRLANSIGKSPACVSTKSLEVVLNVPVIAKDASMVSVVLHSR